MMPPRKRSTKCKVDSGKGNTPRSGEARGHSLLSEASRGKQSQAFYTGGFPRLLPPLAVLTNTVKLYPNPKTHLKLHQPFLFHLKKVLLL